MFSSVIMIYYGIKSYDIEIIRILILSILTLYCGFFATLIWNDITDAKIDAIAHPDRPIPSGRITSKKFFIIALFFSALTFIFAFLVKFECFLLVGLAALFVTFHNKFLRKSIKIPAYSEIVTPAQWIIVPIFGFLAIKDSSISLMIFLVLFTYFADSAHDIIEGIHDADGDKIEGIKTYATSFGEKTASYISFIWFIISGFFGIIIFYFFLKFILFLILFLLLWFYVFFNYYKIIIFEKKNIKEVGLIFGRLIYNYFIFTYNLMFFNIFFLLLINNKIF